MARAPTSLLLLIDRRNRLEGELARLEVLKVQAAQLHRHLKRALGEIDVLLDEHPIDLDWSILEAKATYAKRHSEYGVLTAQVLRALRHAPETGMTSAQILNEIFASWPVSLPHPPDRRQYVSRVRHRLKGLRKAGTLLSPYVGNGSTTPTTWIINKRRWDHEGQE